MKRYYINLSYFTLKYASDEPTSKIITAYNPIKSLVTYDTLDEANADIDKYYGNTELLGIDMMANFRSNTNGRVPYLGRLTIVEYECKSSELKKRNHLFKNAQIVRDVHFTPATDDHTSLTWNQFFNSLAENDISLGDWYSTIKYYLLLQETRERLNYQIPHDIDFEVYRDGSTLKVKFSAMIPMKVGFSYISTVELLNTVKVPTRACKLIQQAFEKEVVKVALYGLD